MPGDDKLSVVCWKWQSIHGYRTRFTAEHVNTLRAMVARHCTLPHEFVCVTDDARDLDERIRVVPLWDDYAEVRSPHGGVNPACYRRLKAFALGAGRLLGRRIVSVDLDAVIVDNVDTLWDRPEDFVIWGNVLKKTPYNGSMWLLKAGARAQVWQRFDPVQSPRLTLREKYNGSDQAWISYVLPDEATWTAHDGVLSFRQDVPLRGPLPPGAKIVFFNGHTDPWTRGVADQYPWVKEHYRL